MLCAQFSTASAEMGCFVSSFVFWKYKEETLCWLFFMAKFGRKKVWYCQQSTLYSINQFLLLYVS